MRWKSLAIAAALVTSPGSLNAATQENFLARSTADLVALCDANGSDPLRVPAVHFCEGYVAGANQFYQSERSVKGAPQLYCLPNPPPSRDEAVRMFVVWAGRNPQYMNDRPVDSLMRFASETWPCRR